MILGAETGEVPSLDALLPPWAQQLSLLGILVVIVFAFLRGWVVTKAQNERDIASERRVSEIWEKNYTETTANNDKLIAAFQPVLSSNEAILKAVSDVQEEQRRMRERRGYER
jgi:hypothetical protein